MPSVMIIAVSGVSIGTSSNTSPEIKLLKKMTLSLIVAEEDI